MGEVNRKLGNLIRRAGVGGSGETIASLHFCMCPSWWKKCSRIFLHCSGPFHSKIQHLKRRKKGKSPHEKNSSASMCHMYRPISEPGAPADLQPPRSYRRARAASIPAPGPTMSVKHETPASHQGDITHVSSSRPSYMLTVA